MSHQKLSTNLPTAIAPVSAMGAPRAPGVRAPKPGPISGRTARILRSHARHIQQLGRRAVKDVIEIGRRLHDAKRRLGHGKFLCWIAHEFGWSERTAENFMRVYDLSCKSEKFADLDLPLSALYLLAAPSTPDTALEEVATRVGNGNGVSIAEVKDIIVKSRRASPLRHSIHIANEIGKTASQIFDVGRTALPWEDVGSLIDRRLAELQGDDEREQVRSLVRHRCSEQLRHCREVQLFQLNREIERLELILKTLAEKIQ